MGRPSPERDWRVLLDTLACTRGRQVEVRELSGGLSNRVLRVTAVDRGGPLDVVVRLPPAAPLTPANRALEHRNTLAAAAAGVGPPVLEVLPDGTLVVLHLDARTLGADDVRADLAGVAALCRRLHSGPPFAGVLDLASVQRRYRSRVVAERTWLPPDHLSSAPAVEEALAALAADPVARVPCHNDLPGGNLLDDGHRLWLVDYEFAAQGDPWCELGNLACGAGLDAGEVDALVTAYAGVALPHRVARTRLWDAVCSWTWVLWASLQEATSELDHDYRATGEALAERARAGLDRRLLDSLVQGLAAPARGAR